jgi:hypothetical protein
MVTGWKLDRNQRESLLKQFPPTWPDVIADHVTYDMESALPAPTAEDGVIVGQADDGRGLQALVVSINGGVHRPDGSTYHITWSINRAMGREPVDSNQVLRELGWRAIDTPIPIKLEPAAF